MIPRLAKKRQGPPNIVKVSVADVRFEQGGRAAIAKLAKNSSLFLTSMAEYVSAMSTKSNSPLILHNLLKTRSCFGNPAYRLIRHNYMKDGYLDFSASEMRQNCDSFRTEVISLSY